MAQKPLCRFWCFTLNNPEGQIDVDLAANDNVRYAIWQLEQGENGTPHFQGYIQLKRTQRLSYLTKLIPGAHFEIAKGSEAQNQRYCTKGPTHVEGPWTVGEPTTTGARNDLLDVKKKLDEGASELAIAEEHFESWCKYGRAFKDYKRLKSPQRDWKTEVTYIYGPPGVGKSRLAKEHLPGAHWLDPPKDKGSAAWWTDYDGKEFVVIDDFYAWLPFGLLMRLLDRYPMTVESKGSSYQFVAKKLYITSNHKPQDLYKPCHPLAALTRRIEHFVKFEENGNHTIYSDYESFVLSFEQFNRHSE